MFKKIPLAILNFFMCHVFYHVKYYNLDKLNSNKKCIVCPNHSSAADPFWIYFKAEDMWIMAKKELFDNKIVGWVLKQYNVFPINRGKKDAKSLIHAINFLNEKENAKLLIFPEGTRIKKDKERGVAKVGPVFIASKSNVNIVPVYITKNPRLFSRVNVVFGDVIDIPTSIDKDKEELRKYSNMLLDKIYSLKDEIK